MLVLLVVWLVRWFAAESRGSSEVLRKGAENNDGAAENNNGAAQRNSGVEGSNTGVAGQMLVRGKQVYIFPEEKLSPDPRTGI